MKKTIIIKLTTYCFLIAAIVAVLFLDSKDIYTVAIANNNSEEELYLYKQLKWISNGKLLFSFEKRGYRYLNKLDIPNKRVSNLIKVVSKGERPVDVLPNSLSGNYWLWNSGESLYIGDKVNTDKYIIRKISGAVFCDVNDKGDIVYIKQGGGVYLIKDKGTEQKIYNGFALGPRFNKDGCSIGFTMMEDGLGIYKLLEKRLFEFHPGKFPNCIEWSPKTNEFLAMARKNDEFLKRIVIIDLNTEKVQNTGSIVDGLDYITWGPSGENIYYSGSTYFPFNIKHLICLRDKKSYKQKVLFKTKNRISYIAISPDEERLAYVENDNICIYNLQSSRKEFIYQVN